MGQRDDIMEDLMVSLSNHEVRRVEALCHALVLRRAQDEGYWTYTPHSFSSGMEVKM